MKIKVKLIITNDKGEKLISDGIIWLLQAIKDHNSISSAARSMRMSYVKALKLINNLEYNLGDKVLERRHGGNDRYGAELTPYGEHLIRKYFAVQKKVNKAADEGFGTFIKAV